jgi:pSer/pThr/pTyr-binding forkhead associated (FHA) protein
MMVDVTLTIYSSEETKEIPLTGDHVSFGRSDAATLMLKDDGLSRVHASIYREGDRVWILDEASTNGTQVNGALVPPAGTPLKNGDEINIGHHTAITVNIRQATSPASVSRAAGTAAATPSNSVGSSWQLPLISVAVGLVLVVLAAVGIVSYASRNKSGEGESTAKLPPARSRSSGNRVANTRPSNDEARPTSNTNSQSAITAPAPTESAPLMDNDVGLSATEQTNRIAPPKLYSAMTQAERLEFVAQEAQHVARRIGNREGSQFVPEALNRIKNNVDAYASRARLGPSTGCRFGQSLTTTLERASTSAPFINRAFNQKGLSPVIGLYLAMIESEYCVCLTSPTGPKGMFQFTRATAVTYGLQIIEPEERCIPEKAAPAAAAYIKALIGRYGTGPLSVPLSIASYNSGEGGLSNNLAKALDAVRTSENPERSFWTLVANADLLSDQFQKENIKYVPKFFAAAIIGENPRVFGVNLEPLSTYTNADTSHKEVAAQP